jgi:nitrogen-specific signal transduction histidine kinase/ActR/RegA family two-component response regulator
VEISTGVVHYNNEKYILAIVQDITERRKAEESFVNIQRLEAIGMLAGGIAHDFNNLLAGILGNIQLAAARTSDDRASLYLSRALGAMDRARSLTRQLLTFSKGGEPEKEAQPLFPFVEETARFALSGSDISCRVDAAADLWPCEFDRNQLGQVIDNIVINARQAMEGGGALEISAVNLPATDSPADGPLTGNGVRVSIRDTGCGMSRETLARVFEPFFTTRESGHGLGLATSFSIMRRHGGHIAMESEPGMGTTVHLYLPAAMGTVRPMPAPPAVERGSGLVLIMDDDADVRDVLAGMLAQLGYGCLLARDGDEAVAAFRSALTSGRPPDAVLLDMTVSGGTGGRGAIGPIRSLSPSTPVFVCSGYAEDPAIADPVSAGFNGSLRKPFRLEELARLLGQSGSR